MTITTEQGARPPLLLSVPEASKEIDLEENRLRELIHQNVIRAVKIPSREGVEPRKLRVPYAELMRYVQSLLDEQAEA